MIFNRDGVLPKMAGLQLQEKSLCEFPHECREAECHLGNNEHF